MSVYGSGELSDLQSLLRGINLLGQDISTVGESGKADPGAVALESVSTSAAKIAGSAVTGVGGASAVVAATGKFWATNASLHGTLVWGFSILAATCLLALAIIVASDLRARARGHEAVYNARGQITAEFLRRSAPAQKASSADHTGLGAEHVALIALAAGHRDVAATVPNGPARLRGIRQSAAEGVMLYVRLDDGANDWVALKDVRLNELRYTAG